MFVAAALSPTNALYLPVVVAPPALKPQAVLLLVVHEAKEDLPIDVLFSPLVIEDKLA